MTALRFTWEQTLRHAALPSTRKLVALMAATYANGDGTRVRPGESELAEACGIDPRTVRRQLVALRESGWLTRTRRGSSQGRRAMADEYRLTLPPDHDHRTPVSGDPAQNTGHQRPEHRTPETGTPDTRVRPPVQDQYKTSPVRARELTDPATVRATLEQTTGRKITDEHTRAVISDVLDRAGTVSNPTAYVVKAIAAEPERYRPVSHPPRLCVVCQHRDAVRGNRCAECPAAARDCVP